MRLTEISADYESPHMVLTDYEKEALIRVSREKSWEHAKWFAESGQKLSGTPENERAVEYILDFLKGYNIQAKAVEYQSWIDFPKPT